MKFLFVFYLSGGGIDPLNRYRCQALKMYGHEGHCLYYSPSPALQNNTDHEVFITNNDEEIRGILNTNGYDFIVVTTDHTAFPRLRCLGYTGKLILEIQGYGAKTAARSALSGASACVTAYASGLLNPCTPHISALYEEFFTGIPKFYFNNPFDAEHFTYKELPKQPIPIIAWIGRAEDNKNWREFLVICHYLLQHQPNLQFWIYEDPTFTQESERKDFLETMDQLGLTPHITLRHNVPHVQMMEHYSMIGDSGGLLISTSKEEGAPYSVLEAMSCRCPVLSSEKDGVINMITYGQTGKLYPLGQVTVAVNEALDLMNNQMVRDYIIQTAQKHVVANFSLHTYVEHLTSMARAIG
ncbi:glycosyltransferase family 4 protein [Paenibacillus polymyxa]|uniref:glycosyltransferase family 4 protein n=1 Tax=Paenibacillus polymyxa TaxID=1406 RepID=UPI002378FDB9|nr:glycosyltransferase [Paenibacillus polymyxa]WDM21127.1 glycosyltransferase [Paenibacillus polymyxa]